MRHLQRAGPAALRPREDSAARDVWGGLAATLIGYFGGGVALDLSEIVAAPLPGRDLPFSIAPAFGLIMFWISGPILIALFVVALLTDRLLERLRRYSAMEYAVAGAVVGVAVGALVVGLFFQRPVRGGLSGGPVGVLAGLAYWSLARPRP